MVFREDIEVNKELIEHELNLLEGESVILVRPEYGTQSDSWNGKIKVSTGTYPLEIQFFTDCMTILFTVNDVVNIESLPNYNNIISKVIRLKGPHQYNENYEKSAH